MANNTKRDEEPEPVALADARAAGALIVDDASLIPPAQLLAAEFVVERCTGHDRGFGVVIKDTRAPRSQRAVQAPAQITPALVIPAQSITVTLDLGDALAGGLQLQSLVAAGIVPSGARELLNRLGTQLKAAALAAAQAVAS